MGADTAAMRLVVRTIEEQEHATSLEADACDLLRSAADEIDELRKQIQRAAEFSQHNLCGDSGVDFAEYLNWLENGGAVPLDAKDREIADTKRALEKLARETGMHSVGTCARCGYHGPGPYHDCAAALFSQLEQEKKRRASAEAALRECNTQCFERAYQANRCGAHVVITDHFTRFGGEHE